MPHIKKLRESTILLPSGDRRARVEAFGEALRVRTPSAFDSDIMYIFILYIIYI